VRAERDTLAADNVRLEEVVHAQAALLTASAHDLKNALAAITLRADLLQDELDDGRETHAEGDVGGPALAEHQPCTVDQQPGQKGR
jgi:signal transduction histidine kinase